MSRPDTPKSGPASPWRRKYRHYAFVSSLLVILLCMLALLNAYLRFNTSSSYASSLEGLSSPLVLAGYLGMFLSIWISPVPDYVLVPAYGYLSSIGLFNPYYTFLVCLAAALVPIEYAAGRLVPRPLLMKGLHYLHVSQDELLEADRWIVEHGNFSIFIATFIPFFYSVSCLAAGTLKMRAASFFIASTLGFGLRFVFLEVAGYESVYLFTASFDYSQRAPLALILVLSLGYAVAYLLEGRMGRSTAGATAARGSSGLASA